VEPVALKHAFSRRDVLIWMLGLGAACRGRTPVPRFEGGFVPTAMADGHKLRGARTEAPATAPQGEIPVLILGAGIAGLSAGWELLRRGVENFAILELEDAPGGTSSSGRSAIGEYPWGAHYLPAPPAHNADLVELLREVGSVTGFDEHGEPIYREDHYVAAPKERVFFRGAWHEGLFPRVGASTADLEDMARFEAEVAAFVAARSFQLPLAVSADTPELRALDQLSMAEWLERKSLRAPLFRWWVELAARDDFATELGELSAWYGLHYFAARTERAGAGSAELLTWPSGNGYLVDHLVARLGAARIEYQSLVTAVRLAADGRRARVSIHDRAAGAARAIVAERVIFALPSFLRARLLGEELAAPPLELETAPWLVANIHLSDRPGYNGFPSAWDNAIYGSRSLGYVSATHQTHRDRGPTVWTYYLPLSGADPRAERRKLEALDYAGAADAIVHELAGCHRDLLDKVRRIDVMRWGHGMVRPRPGTAYSADRARAARPAGPIHFAHTDLSGVAVFEEAFFHGVRAAREVSASLGGSRP
jgi:phytoene dehydrogenase-like protein